MPCLNHVHKMLESMVPGVRREDVAHVSHAMFCPCLACKGVIKVHGNNGTFVAVAEEGRVLYARCADRTCLCSEEEIKQACMETVPNSGLRPWVKITPIKLEELEKNVRNTPAQTPSRKRQKV